MGNIETARERYTKAVWDRDRLKRELVYAEIELTDATDHIFELLEV